MSNGSRITGCADNLNVGTNVALDANGKIVPDTGAPGESPIGIVTEVVQHLSGPVVMPSVVTTAVGNGETITYGPSGVVYTANNTGAYPPHPHILDTLDADSPINESLFQAKRPATSAERLLTEMRGYFCDYYGIPPTDTANIICNCVYDPIFGISITAPKNATKNVGQEPRADKMAHLLDLAAVATMETFNYHNGMRAHTSSYARFDKLLPARPDPGAIPGVLPVKGYTVLGQLLKHAADTSKTPEEWAGGPVSGEVGRLVVERAMLALGGNDLGKRAAIRNAVLKGTDASLSESLGTAVLGEVLALAVGTLPRTVFDAPTWGDAMSPHGLSLPVPQLYAVFYDRTTHKATQINLWALHAAVCRLLGDYTSDGATIPYVLGYVQILSAMAVVGGYDFGVQWPFLPASYASAQAPMSNLKRFPYVGVNISIMRQADPKGESTYAVSVYDQSRKILDWPVPQEKANAASDLMSAVFQQVSRCGILMAVPAQNGRIAMVTADKYARISGMRLSGTGQIGLPPSLNWTGIDITGVIESAAHQIREIIDTKAFRNTMIATRNYARNGVLDDPDVEKEPAVDPGGIPDMTGNPPSA